MPLTFVRLIDYRSVALFTDFILMIMGDCFLGEVRSVNSRPPPYLSHAGMTRYLRSMDACEALVVAFADVNNLEYSWATLSLYVV